MTGYSLAWLGNSLFGESCGDSGTIGPCAQHPANAGTQNSPPTTVNNDDNTMLAEQETLSEDEQAAVDAQAAGKPYDPKVYNRARQKQIKNEKYNKQRNKRKQRGSG